MAKIYTHTDLLAKHAQLRKVVSRISKETTAVRQQANKIREETERLYADSGHTKVQRRNLVNEHVRRKMESVTEPVKDRVLPFIKEMEGHRLELAEAADIMSNPISYCNAVTIGSPKLLEQRAAASVLIANMGPAALRVASEMAKASGDVGMIAALVDRNDQLPAGDRPFSNAELMKDVKLPGFDDAQAVFAEVELLPEYAMACSRALEKGGDISPNDRVRIGLAENKVNILEDGSLAEFQTTEAPRYKLDGTELIQPKKPKPCDDLDPLDFETSDAFIEAGGNPADHFDNEEVVKRWYGEEDAA